MSEEKSNPVAKALDARPYLTLAVAVILAQAVYWLGLSPSSQRTPIPPEMLVGEFEAALIETPSPTVLQTAAWFPVSAGWSTCCDEKLVAFRFSVVLDRQPAEDYALIAGLNADNYRIYVNDYILFDEGEMSPTPTYHGRVLRGPMRVSRAMLREGENEVAMIAARDGDMPIGVYRHAFGDYETIVDAASKRAFMTGPVRLVVTILFGFFALFAIILTPISKHRGFMFWFALLCTSLFVNSAFNYWTGAQIPPTSRYFVIHAVENLTPIAWIGFIEAWSGGRWRRFRSALLGIFALLTLVTAIAIYGFGRPGHLFVEGLSDFLYFAGGVGAIALFVWRLRAGLADRPWEAAALSVAMTAMAGEVMSEVFSGFTRDHLSYALPFVITAFVVAILARNIRIYDSMAAFNQSLNRELAKREAEIRASYQEMRAAQRERDVADERQRIMRDMHDGVGGQLVSLLARARRGDLKTADLTAAISASLTDLRLLIDSLESVGDSLDMALARFHERMRPMLEAQKIELHWRNRLDHAAPAFSQRDLLNIHRILQEAVANAVNHGRPSLIEIEIEEASDPARRLTVRVKDDGAGFNEDAWDAAGRGLENMKTRAAAIGGDLEIASSPGGPTVVILRLPDQTTAASAQMRVAG